MSHFDSPIYKAKIALKEAANIVEVINYYQVGLRKQGRLWKACCPFHSEDTPSFTVDTIRQRYRCFGGSCGKGGDVLNFIQEYEHCDFKTALVRLAEIINRRDLLPDELL